MNPRWFLLAVSCVGGSINAGEMAGPEPAPMTPALETPKDVDFPGTLEIRVDATDLAHRVFTVHETVPVPPGGDLVLLYPKWLPGAHAPEGPIDRLAGLAVKSGSSRIPWTRDVVDVYAFHVAVPQGTRSVEVDFQYLSPVSTTVGPIEVTSTVLALDWNAVVLYPAGYFVRRIPVDVQLTLPPDFEAKTALEVASSAGGTTSFLRTSLETLVDSPVRAGRYAKTYDLFPGQKAPVRLDVVAEREGLLEVKPAVLDAFRSLAQEAQRLFGSHHYDHYDFLVSLSDTIGDATTLEHHRSAEYGEGASTFADWDKTVADRDELAHEFVHSWDGKFRRPADLWTPDYTTPMRNTLLWVYEGGTQYWGKVLAARSGLWTKQQTLDALAIVAASLENTRGRTWRPLQDTTVDEIVNPRRPQSWENWQRFEDYYDEGAFVWLEADTLIRERSKGKRSLDDFSKAFFGIADGSYTPVVYTFDDVVRALNAVEAYDWATFLRTRLDREGGGAPLDGLRRGGYKLVYTDTPSDYWALDHNKTMDLGYSLGFTVDKDAALSVVTWDGPAFKAGLTVGTRLVAVNGVAYDGDKLKDAITEAKGKTSPIELLVRNDDRFRTVTIDYHEGLRYPHLERDASEPARLDDILAPRH